MRSQSWGRGGYSRWGQGQRPVAAPSGEGAEPGPVGRVGERDGEMPQPVAPALGASEGLSLVSELRVWGPGFWV